MPNDFQNTARNRVIRAARGTRLSARSWLTEAPLRMLMNNLDPEVAERPEDDPGGSLALEQVEELFRDARVR